MLNWIRDVYRRNRRKLLTIGAVAGGAFVTYKYISWRLSKWRELEIEEYKIQAKKQFHYESNQQTCRNTFMQLLVPLRNKIFRALNTEEVTEALNNHPENKLELWEDLKLLGFSRTMTSVIATCTLYMFLQVQMNIIGGYMYLEGIDSVTGNADISELIHDIEMDKSISNLQREYMNNIRFLLEDGILRLIDDIKGVINGIIKPISLKTKLNHYEVSQLIFNIWDHFKMNACSESRGACDSSASSYFSSYILDSELCKRKTIYFDEQKYQQILSETLDVVESEDFQTVLTDCVKECLEHTMQSVEQSFQHFQTAGLALSDSCQEYDLKMPLAKLVPVINAQSSHIFKAGENQFLKTLFSIESVASFSANIYESFSFEPND